MPGHDRRLPIREKYRSMMFVARPVLGQQTGPVLGVCLDTDAALLLYSLDFPCDDRQHCDLALVDQPGPGVGAEDAEHGHPGLGDKMAVSEIETKEIGVGRLIIRRSWRARATWTSRRLGVQFGTAPRAVAVEPVAGGISRDGKYFADFAEGNTLRAQSQGLLTDAGWMHAHIFEQGYDNLCPRWDSNPHCMDFESIACCRLGYGDRRIGRIGSPVQPSSTRDSLPTTLRGAVPTYRGVATSGVLGVGVPWPTRRLGPIAGGC